MSRCKKMKQDEETARQARAARSDVVAWRQLAGGRLVKKKACVGDERGVDGDFALGITALYLVGQGCQKHARANPPHQQRDGRRTPRWRYSAQVARNSALFAGTEERAPQRPLPTAVHRSSATAASRPTSIRIRHQHSTAPLPQQTSVAGEHNSSPLHSSRRPNTHA